MADPGFIPSNTPEFLGFVPSWYEQEEDALSKISLRFPKGTPEYKEARGNLLWHQKIRGEAEERIKSEHAKFLKTGFSPKEYAERLWLEKNDPNGWQTSAWFSVLQSSLDTALMDRAGALFKFIGNDEYSKQAYEAVDRNARTRAIANKYSNHPSLRGIGQSAAGSAAKFFTAAPTGMAGVIGDAGATAFGRGLYDAKEAGLDGPQQAAYAGLQAGIEMGFTLLFNRVGMQGIERFKGLTFNKTAFRAVAEEIPEELSIEFAQAFNARLSGVDPEELTPERMSELFKHTLINTIASAGLIEGVRRNVPSLFTTAEPGEGIDENVVISEAAQEYYDEYKKSSEEAIQATQETEPLATQETAAEPITEEQAEQALSKYTAEDLGKDPDNVYRLARDWTPQNDWTMEKIAGLNNDKGEPRSLSRKEFAQATGISGYTPVRARQLFTDAMRYLHGKQTQETGILQDTAELTPERQKILERQETRPIAGQETMQDKPPDELGGEMPAPRPDLPPGESQQEFTDLPPHEKDQQVHQNWSKTDPSSPDTKIEDQDTSGMDEELDQDTDEFGDKMGIVPPIVAKMIGLYGDKPQDGTHEIPYPNEEVKKRIEESNTHHQDQALDGLANWAKGFFTSRVKMPFRGNWFKGDPTLEPYHRLFRLFGIIPSWATGFAHNLLRPILQPLGGKQDIGAFENLLMMRDVVKHLGEKGNMVPYGMTPEDARTFLTDLEKVAKNSPNIQKALTRRAKRVKMVTSRLVQAGLLPEDAIDNDEYYHREILWYRKNTRRFSHKLQAKKAGFQHPREVSEKQYEKHKDPAASYIVAEGAWLMDAAMALRTHALKEGFRAKSIGIMDEINDEAAATSRPVQDVYEEWLSSGDYKLYAVGPVSGLFPTRTPYDKALKHVMGWELVSPVDKPRDITEDDEKIIKAMAMGNHPMILPAPVVDQLHEMDRYYSVPEAIIPAIARFTNQWKRWILLNPMKVVPYNLRNLIGDFDAFLSVPSIFTRGSWKHWKHAGKDLWSLHFGDPDAKLSKDAQIAINEGVFDSTIATTELQAWKTLPEFKKFRENSDFTSPMKALKSLGSLAKNFGYYSKVTNLTQFREAYLRYVSFLHYRDQLKSGTLKDYGASPKDAIDALMEEEGADAAAAQMTKDLLIDYSDTTVKGKQLAATLMPFWRFVEGNVRRYPRLVWNATAVAPSLTFKEVRDKGGSKAEAALKATWVGSLLNARRVAAFTSIWLYNWFAWEDELDDLPEYDRINTPIILGRKPDGRINVFRNVTSFGDFLEFFGIPHLITSLPNYKAGQLSAAEVMLDTTKSVTNRLNNMIGPHARGFPELLLGQATAPDIFEPRQMNRGEMFFRYFGMADMWRAGEGAIMKNGSRARPHFLERWLMGVSDPRYATLNTIYEARDRFDKKKGRATSGPRSQSKWRFVRDAASVEDYEAFVEGLNYVFTESGGTFRGWKSFISHLDPIAAHYNVKDEREFEREYLTPEQQLKLHMARDYSKELRSTLWAFYHRARREGRLVRPSR